MIVLIWRPVKGLNVSLSSGRSGFMLHALEKYSVDDNKALSIHRLESDAKTF